MESINQHVRQPQSIAQFSGSEISRSSSASTAYRYHTFAKVGEQSRVRIVVIRLLHFATFVHIQVGYDTIQSEFHLGGDI